ncbi:MAG: hypothetical protein IJ043_06320 [Clostridia bacterium]|nr:hypothetical protein [Clostridia bacterium]
MKLFRSAMLILAETAAFGWFILRDISFMAVLPLVPLSLLYYYLHRLDCSKTKWLNGVSAIVSSVIVAYTVSLGVFDGRGFISLLCLSFLVALMAFRIPKTELIRITGWWSCAFLVVFIAMFLATLPGIRLRDTFPSAGKWSDILIFYLLVFAEPLSMGKEYRASPLALSILLIPFGLASYLALGKGAFLLAEYPYLSVWAGVAVSAFHHTEGIILCLYYGLGVFRLAHFFVEFRKNHCNEQKIIV